jgi:molybdopterin-containing oxidoreductase family iron-sulfur binding subunit
MSKMISPAGSAPGTGQKYWRSLDELAETPEFRSWVEQEFPSGAEEMSDPVTRRGFMKLMSASFLLAGVGLTGCRRPVENIRPFSKMPEGYVHGVAQHYATAMPVRGSAVPLLVKSHEGRPVKVEGNPEHPAYGASGEDSGRRKGGTDLYAQASILNLYDPDRAHRFTFQGATVGREKALDALAKESARLAGVEGQGLCVLLERSSSPTRERLIAGLRAKLPKARWFVYEPVDFEVHRRGASVALGQPVQPVYRLEHARRILSLDCDFIGGEQDTYPMVKGFAQSRRLKSAAEDMSRLYQVESLLTVTGANADHRLRLPSSQVLGLASLVFREVVEQGGVGARVPGAAEMAKAVAGLAGGVPVEVRAWAKTCAKDLVSAPGTSLVLAGCRQPVEVHVLAQALNFLLQAPGKTVEYVAVAEEAPAGTIEELAKALNAGEVETLVVLGGNPAYTAPGDLAWSATQRKAKTVIRLGDFEDETFAGCDWHWPRAHYLESWGDARTREGTVVAIQPLVEPLFGDVGGGGMTEIEFLARLGGQVVAKPYDLTRETFRGLSSDGVFEERWKQFLHDGFLPGSEGKPAKVEAVVWEAAAKLVGAAPVAIAASAQKLEVVFSRDYRVDDGRYTNNGWLQELPDPITKIVWDNVVQMSPKTAQELGVEVVDENRMRLQVPVVRLTLGGRRIEGPAWIQPGLADNVIGLTLGHGRSGVGRVGRGTGYDAYPLRAARAPNFEVGAQLEKTGARYPLSCTQNHWYMQGRPVVREANLEEYRKNPGFARAYDMHEPPGPRDAHGHPEPMYPNPLDALKAQSTHQWGMSVDLNACVGCAACVIACQSENNIPIVGKDQVNRGREMHWLRIDRYFVGGLADPQVANQPVMCQHCESAPCESVCPVNATVHDHEGLNVMAYNRCVGTRYCSNNCPFKVRRYNFLDYNRRSLEQLKGPFYSSPLVSMTDGEWTLKRWFKDPDRGIRPQDEWDLLKLARNPEVTVRMRGVMEKCSFCVQRIEQAKIAQKVKAGASSDVEVRDGGVQTACEQACPAEAIVFGNVKDEHSRVSRAKAQDRRYDLLEFLAVKPRVTYLARVRNPNAEMPDYQAQPATEREFLETGASLQEGGHGHEGATGGPSGAGHGSGHEGASGAGKGGH